MAMAMPSDEEYVDIITCSICLDILRTPTSLKCLHTFCADCLKTWITRNEYKSQFPCPICKAAVRTENLEDSCRKNFTLQNLVDVHQKSKRKGDKVPFSCDNCMKDGQRLPAAARCVECAKNLCHPCRKEHTRLTYHRLYDLTGDRKKDAQLALELYSQRIIACPNHGHPLKFFCSIDKTPTCRPCCIGKRASHKFLKIEQVAAEQLSSLMVLVEQRRELYVSHVQLAETTSQNHTENNEDVLQKLQADRRAKHHELDIHFNQLEIAAEWSHQENMEKLNDVQVRLELQGQSTEILSGALSRKEKYDHPVDIVQSIIDIREQLQVWTVQPEGDTTKIGPCLTAFHQRKMEIGAALKLQNPCENTKALYSQCPTLHTGRIHKSIQLEDCQTTRYIKTNFTLRGMAFAENTYLVLLHGGKRRLLVLYNNETHIKKYSVHGPFLNVFSVNDNCYAV
ncbi:unnamed protein product [Owenia fusiformis]|uniref:Uncharacterized protein n=1 Tax=Owenia fusiformis TaxID=6347 RepID=A0A8J1U250_OWEFU|nr:unnamed protein product [Owenia fusiformis]